MKNKYFFVSEKELVNLLANFAPYDAMFNDKRNFNVTKRNAKRYWNDYKELNGLV